LNEKIRFRLNVNGRLEEAKHEIVRKNAINSCNMWINDAFTSDTVACWFNGQLFKRSQGLKPLPLVQPTQIETAESK
jgi:hypothetical protein